jgi:hypothetical protein
MATITINPLDDTDLPPQTLSINPIDSGTITAADLLNGTVTISGTETGLDGAQINVEPSQDTPRPTGPFGNLVTTGINGTWSTTVPEDFFKLHEPNSSGVDGTYTIDVTAQFGATFSTAHASENVQVSISTLIESAAQLETLTPAQIDQLQPQGTTSIVSTGPGDTEFSAAQVKAIETDGLMVSGPTGAQMELSDSAANVLALLNGHTFADLAVGLQNLEKVGITDMDVSVGQQVFDVHIDTLLHEVNDLITLLGHESPQAQDHQITEAFNHLNHGLFHV